MSIGKWESLSDIFDPDYSPSVLSGCCPVSCAFAINVTTLVSICMGCVTLIYVTVYVLGFAVFYWSKWKQGKSEGFDSCDRPSNLKLDSHRRFFSLCDLEIWWITSRNNRALFSIISQALCIISNASVNSNWSHSPKTLNWGRNWGYLVPCDLEIWWMTLDNNRAPLLYYIKLCASFQINRWSQTCVTVRKR